MADPKVPEENLTSQGQIYRRVSNTDEKTPEVAREYRGERATPEQKADNNKPWISEDYPGARVRASIHDENDDSSRPKPDIIAQEVYKRLGPLNAVEDKIADTIETAKETISGFSKLASETAAETKDSVAGTYSQYTDAAWDKVNELKPTNGANEPPKQDKESTLDERMAESLGKGQHDTSAIAEKVKDKMPSAPDVGHKLLAAGGDDVLKVLADGESTQDDPQKAKMRAVTEMLI